MKKAIIKKNTTTMLLCFILSMFTLQVSACAKGDAETEDTIPTPEVWDGGDEINVLVFKGVTNNDHEMIQKALDFAKANKIPTVYIPAGEYNIIATTPEVVYYGISIPSNVHLRLHESAILKAIPNNSGGYAVVRVHNVSNVKISGGKVLGERNQHIGTGGEWGMGIDIRGAHKVEIQNITIDDCWGDGIYLGGDIVTEVIIDNVKTNNNRRQGISAVHNDGLIIKNSIFSTTKGTLPEAGIDLEPNAGQLVKNVEIFNCHFESNKTYGLLMWGAHGPVSDVKVYDCTIKSSNEGIHLGWNVHDISFSNIKVDDSNTNAFHLFNGVANINLENSQLNNSGKRGILLDIATGFIGKNLQVNNYEKGVELKKVKQVSIQNSFFQTSNPSATGFESTDSEKLVFDNVSISKGQTGMSFFKVVDLELLNSNLQELSHDGLYTNDVDKGKIQGNRWENIAQSPIVILNSKNFEVKQNTMVGNSFSIDNFYAVVKVDGTSTSNVFTNNTIQKGAQNNRPKYGFWLASSTSGNTVSGNIVNVDSYHTAALKDEGSNTILP